MANVQRDMEVLRSIRENNQNVDLEKSIRRQQLENAKSTNNVWRERNGLQPSQEEPRVGARAAADDVMLRIANIDNGTARIRLQSAVQQSNARRQAMYDPANPTLRGASALLNTRYGSDPNRRDRLLTDLAVSASFDPNSPFYKGNYASPSNQEIINNLSALGFDMSGGVTPEWIEQNRWLQDEYVYENDTSTTPKNVTTPSNIKKYTPVQQAAYWYYQLLKDEENTQNAENEWAQMQKDIAYFADLGYDDDEIISQIRGRMSNGDYATLAKMQEYATNGLGRPMGLNRAIPYDEDSIYGAIWAARNGGGTGNALIDTIYAGAGIGVGWKYDPQSKAARDPSSASYNPYLLPTYRLPEGYDPDNDDGSWKTILSPYTDRENGGYKKPKNPTPEEQRAWEIYLAQDNIETTRKAQQELAALQQWAAEELENGATVDEILKRLEASDYNRTSMSVFEANYPTLAKMELFRKQGTYLPMTAPVDYTPNSFRAWLENKVESGSENSTEEQEQVAPPDNDFVENYITTKLAQGLSESQILEEIRNSDSLTDEQKARLSKRLISGRPTGVSSAPTPNTDEIADQDFTSPQTPYGYGSEDQSIQNFVNKWGSGYSPSAALPGAVTIASTTGIPFGEASERTEELRNATAQEQAGLIDEIKRFRRGDLKLEDASELFQMWFKSGGMDLLDDFRFNTTSTVNEEGVETYGTNLNGPGWGALGDTAHKALRMLGNGTLTADEEGELLVTMSHHYAAAKSLGMSLEEFYESNSTALGELNEYTLLSQKRDLEYQNAVTTQTRQMTGEFLAQQRQGEVDENLSATMQSLLVATNIDNEKKTDEYYIQLAAQIKGISDREFSASLDSDYYGEDSYGARVSGAEYMAMQQLDNDLKLAKACHMSLAEFYQAYPQYRHYYDNEDGIAHDAQRQFDSALERYDRFAEGVISAGIVESNDNMLPGQVHTEIQELLSNPEMLAERVNNAQSLSDEEKKNVAGVGFFGWATKGAVAGWHKHIYDWMQAIDFWLVKRDQSTLETAARSYYTRDQYRALIEESLNEISDPDTQAFWRQRVENANDIYDVDFNYLETTILERLKRREGIINEIDDYMRENGTEFENWMYNATKSATASFLQQLEVKAVGAFTGLNALGTLGQLASRVAVTTWTSGAEAGNRYYAATGNLSHAKGWGLISGFCDAASETLTDINFGSGVAQRGAALNALRNITYAGDPRSFIRGMQMLARVTGRYGLQMAGESVGEGIQEGLQYTLGWGIDSLALGDAQKFDIAEMINEMGVGAISVIPFGLFQTVAYYMPAFKTAHQYIKAGDFTWEGFADVCEVYGMTMDPSLPSLDQGYGSQFQSGDSLSNPRGNYYTGRFVHDNSVAAQTVEELLNNDAIVDEVAPLKAEHQEAADAYATAQENTANAQTALSNAQAAASDAMDTFLETPSDSGLSQAVIDANRAVERAQAEYAAAQEAEAQAQQEMQKRFGAYSAKLETIFKEARDKAEALVTNGERTTEMLREQQRNRIWQQMENAITGALDGMGLSGDERAEMEAWLREYFSPITGQLREAGYKAGVSTTPSFSDAETGDASRMFASGMSDEAVEANRQARYDKLIQAAEGEVQALYRQYAQDRTAANKAAYDAAKARLSELRTQKAMSFTNANRLATARARNALLGRGYSEAELNRLGITVSGPASEITSAITRGNKYIQGIPRKLLSGDERIVPPSQEEISSEAERLSQRDDGVSVVTGSIQQNVDSLERSSGYITQLSNVNQDLEEENLRIKEALRSSSSRPQEASAPMPHAPETKFVTASDGTYYDDEAYEGSLPERPLVADVMTTETGYIDDVGTEDETIRYIDRYGNERTLTITEVHARLRENQSDINENNSLIKKLRNNYNRRVTELSLDLAVAGMMQDKILRQQGAGDLIDTTPPSMVYTPGTRQQTSTTQTQETTQAPESVDVDMEPTSGPLLPDEYETRATPSQKFGYHKRVTEIMDMINQDREAGGVGYTDIGDRLNSLETMLSGNGADSLPTLQNIKREIVAIRDLIEQDRNAGGARNDTTTELEQSDGDLVEQDNAAGGVDYSNVDAALEELEAQIDSDIQEESANAAFSNPIRQNGGPMTRRAREAYEAAEEKRKAAQAAREEASTPEGSARLAAERGITTQNDPFARSESIMDRETNNEYGSSLDEADSEFDRTYRELQDANSRLQDAQAEHDAAQAALDEARASGSATPEEIASLTRARNNATRALKRARINQRVAQDRFGDTGKYRSEMYDEYHSNTSDADRNSALISQLDAELEDATHEAEVLKAELDRLTGLEKLDGVNEWIRQARTALKLAQRERSVALLAIENDTTGEAEHDLSEYDERVREAQQELDDAEEYRRREMADRAARDESDAYLQTEREGIQTVGLPPQAATLNKRLSGQIQTLDDRIAALEAQAQTALRTTDESLTPEQRIQNQAGSANLTHQIDQLKQAKAELVAQRNMILDDRAAGGSQPVAIEPEQEAPEQPESTEAPGQIPPLSRYTPAQQAKGANARGSRLFDYMETEEGRGGAEGQQPGYGPTFVEQAANGNGGDTYSLRPVSPVVQRSVDANGNPTWVPGHTEAWFRENGYPIYADVDSDVAGADGGAVDGHGTQIKTTVSTYRKLFDSIKKMFPDNWQNMRILDASSGLGLGTRIGRDLGFSVDDIEPFPSSTKYMQDASLFGDEEPGIYSPMFTDYSQLEREVLSGKREGYDFIISNAVLNVIPQDTRDNLVSAMASLLKPGGTIFINVIDRNYSGATSSAPSVQYKTLSNGRRVPIGSVRTQEGDYSTVGNKSGRGHETFVWGSNSVQKVFSTGELIGYLQDALGDGYDIRSTALGMTGVLVHKSENYSQGNTQVSAQNGERAFLQDTSGTAQQASTNEAQGDLIATTTAEPDQTTESVTDDDLNAALDELDSAINELSSATTDEEVDTASQHVAQVRQRVEGMYHSIEQQYMIDQDRAAGSQPQVEQPVQTQHTVEPEVGTGEEIDYQYDPERPLTDIERMRMRRALANSASKIWHQQREFGYLTGGAPLDAAPRGVTYDKRGRRTYDHGRWKPGRIQNPWTIARRLAERLGVGHNFETQNNALANGAAAGVANMRVGYIAITARDSGAMETSYHELGHIVAGKLGMTGDDRLIGLMDEEFRNRYINAGLESDLPDESVAEFFATYLVAQDKGESLVGSEFIEDFEQRMKDAGIYKAVMEARDATQNYIGASLEEQARTIFEHRNDVDVRTRPKRFKDWIHNITVGQFDRAESATRIDNLVRSHGVDVSLANQNSVAGYARRIDFAPDITGEIMTDKLIAPNGHYIDVGLAPLLSDNGVNEQNKDAFWELKYLQHSIERAANGHDFLTMPIAQRQQQIEEILAAHPNFEAASDAVDAWWKKFMQAWMVDAGTPLTQNVFNRFNEVYKHYVPVLHLNDYNMKADMNHTAHGKTYTPRYAGNITSPIVDPVEAYNSIIGKIVEQGMRSRMLQQFDEDYEQYEGLGAFARRISTAPARTELGSPATGGRRRVSGNAAEIAEAVERILDSGAQDARRLTIYRNDGSSATYEIYDDSFAELANGIKHNAKSEYKIARRVTKAMTTLTTGRNMLFALKNAIRDFQMSVNRGSWAVTYADGLFKWGRAFFQVMVSDIGERIGNEAMAEYGEYQDYRTFGGGNSEAYTSEDANDTGKLYRRMYEGADGIIRGNSAKTKARALARLGLSIVTAEHLNEWIEATSRYAEYRFGAEHRNLVRNIDSMTEDEILANREKAFMDAQEVTTNFRRGGNAAVLSALKAFIPFYNASVQGALNTARVLASGEIRGKRRAAIFTKTVVNTLIAQFASSALCKIFLDDEEQEALRLIDRSYLDEYYLLPNPFYETSGCDRLVRIPKGQDPFLRGVADGVQQIFWGEGIKSDGSRGLMFDLADVFDSITNVMLPISFSRGGDFNLKNTVAAVMGSTILGPLTDVLFNQNYYGSDIVPESKIKKLGEQNMNSIYYDTTPALFVWLARMTDGTMSPLQLQYIFKQYTGFVGQMGIPALYEAFEGAIEEEDASTRDRLIRGTRRAIDAVIGVARRSLTADPWSATDVMSNFYDSADFLNGIKTAVKSDQPLGQLRNMDAETALKAYQSSLELINGPYSEAYDAINKYYGEVTRRIERSDMTDGEKRAALDHARGEMMDVVLRALEKYGQFRYDYTYHGRAQRMRDQFAGGNPAVVDLPGQSNRR